MGRCVSSTLRLEKKRQKALYLRRKRQEEVLKAAGVRVSESTVLPKSLDTQQSLDEIKKVLVGSLQQAWGWYHPAEALWQCPPLTVLIKL